MGTRDRHDGLGKDERGVHEKVVNRVSQVRNLLDLTFVWVLLTWILCRYAGVTVDTNLSNISKLPSEYYMFLFWLELEAIHLLEDLL